ncbi:MAG: DinB family protein [Planctomycetes bacterium]|nr:DinB family protein [Planctomycetota bacterium]
MFLPDGLLDLHQRTHTSLQKLVDHCSGFSADELARELEGFGYPSIRHQLHHVIGAEHYWLGVLRGEILVDEDPADMADIGALRAYRERVVAKTVAYLQTADETELNTRRRVTAWGPREIEVVPAHVILRTQTHIFQHQGQVAAMARLLGRPIPPGLDFPLA